MKDNSAQNMSISFKAWMMHFKHWNDFENINHHGLNQSDLVSNILGEFRLCAKYTLSVYELSDNEIHNLPVFKKIGDLVVV